MQDVYKDIGEYNADKERKILIFFDDVIADMITNKELNSVRTDLFIRGRKLNISLVFIKKSYFKVPEDARVNSAYIFIMKISNKREKPLKYQLYHQANLISMNILLVKNITI